MTYFNQSSTSYGSKSQAILTPSIGATTDIVIVNNGTGALQRSITDGTTSNQRGQYALDLQGGRSATNQVASGNYSAIVGGYANTASGDYSSILGGNGNISTTIYSNVIGGQSNASYGTISVILGGGSNISSGTYSTLLGGNLNTVSSFSSTIIGGSSNSCSGTGDNLIMGGGLNLINISGVLDPTGDTNTYSTIGGGSSNHLTNGDANVICGGYYHQMSQHNCVIGGGVQNYILGGGESGNYQPNTVIAGGAVNMTDTQVGATISGGSFNSLPSTTGDEYHVIAGGTRHDIEGCNASFIGGGSHTKIKYYSSQGSLAGYKIDMEGSESAAACGTYNNSLPFSSGSYSAGRIFTVGGGPGPYYSNVNYASVMQFVSGASGGWVIADVGFLTSAGADFGEMYESLDKNAIPVGTPVAFQPGTNKIIPVTPNMVISGKKILPFGVISNTCAYIGNACFEYWHGRFEQDEDGNAVLIDLVEEKEVPSDDSVEEKDVREQVYEEKEMIKEERVYDKTTDTVKIIRKPNKIKIPVMEVCDVIDETGKIIGKENIHKTITKKVQVKVKGPTKIEKIVKKTRKESSQYRKDEKYIPRLFREEWNIVGLLGKIKVLHGCPVNPKWTKIEDGSKYDTYFIRS